MRQGNGIGGDRRKARSDAERMALCVLRADLPRLRGALDIYARCITDLVEDLRGSDGQAARSRALLAGLRREHDDALADLDRLVGLLEAGVSETHGASPAAAAAEDC
ncbi:hypothetical protein [Rhodoplanes roseus]|uniref:Uncharacterized protein n=1 Tax=Rhodoplanes roseus TaxID=29409 RepID=A0A327KZA1_9BRAD|nr:hypothetical protein [Rhodoplanes roseus]RAI42993.1 hypothetical protein CH341_16635 [Rhodoplanes roseus]